MRLLLLLAAAAPLVAQCTFTITPAPLPAQPFTIPATAGNYTVDVQTATGCTWTYRLAFPTGTPAWITLAFPSTNYVNGNASIAWSAAANPNPGTTRQAQFVIQPPNSASYIVNITQAAPTCVLSLSPAASGNIAVTGGSGSFNVNTNCSWSTSSGNWITVPYTTGTSNGSVNFTVAANACVASRTGLVTVAQGTGNQSFTVNQAGSDANLTMAPASLTVQAAATTSPITVQVNTGAGCGWSSSRDVSWMRIASGASGSGTATMLVVVDANPATDPRTGHITIGKAVFTLTQQGAAAPAPQLSEVDSAASFASGPVSPGEIVSLFGTNMGPANGAVLQLSADGRSVSKSLAGVQVLFDGAAAALTYVSAKQINAVVPYGVSGSTAVQVQFQSASTNTLTVPVQAAAPGVFTADASGRGGGAILNQDGVTLNSPANPAPAGSVVSIYCTGGGTTNPPGTDGAITPAALPYLLLTQPVAVTVGGAPSPKIWYAGAAPGSIAGLTQINAVIPAGLPSGPNPLVVQIGSQQSQTGVVVYVQ